jgi:hypothetical protein
LEQGVFGRAGGDFGEAEGVAVGADHGFDGDLVDFEEEVCDVYVRFHERGGWGSVGQ